MNNWRNILGVKKEAGGNNMGEGGKIIKQEKREYIIEGDADQLDELEKALNFMSWSDAVGHSDSFNLSFDGDGVANVKVKRKDGEKMKEVEEGNEALSEENEISFDIGN